MDNKKSAEKNRTDYAEVRSPDCEDNKCDCEPASVAKCVVRPYAAGIVHNIVEAAEACNDTAEAYRNVLVFADVDSGGVCRCRILADCTEIKSRTGTVEIKRNYNCDCDCNIGKEAV